MLIVTYSLVTLSVEQEKTRHILSALQQHSQQYAMQPQRRDGPGLEAVLNQFTKFDDACRQRNVELYLIPALRRATQEADFLLSELEALSDLGASILRSARHRLQQDIELGAQKTKELAGAMGSYCQHLLSRLAKEEEELFPTARRMITSEEEWFAIAAQFISHGAELHAYKPSIASGAPTGDESAQGRHHLAAKNSAPLLALHD